MASERALPRTFIDTVPDCIYVKDASRDQIQLANKAWLKSGATRRTSSRQDGTDVFSPGAGEEDGGAGRRDSQRRTGDARAASSRFTVRTPTGARTGRTGGSTAKVPLCATPRGRPLTIRISQDINEQKLSARRREMEHAVTRVLSESRVARRGDAAHTSDASAKAWSGPAALTGNGMRRPSCCAAWRPGTSTSTRSRDSRRSSRDSTNEAPALARRVSPGPAPAVWCAASGRAAPRSGSPTSRSGRISAAGRRPRKRACTARSASRYSPAGSRWASWSSTAATSRSPTRRCCRSCGRSAARSGSSSSARRRSRRCA